MEILTWIAIIVLIGLSLNAGLILRYRIFSGEWPSSKVLLIFNVILIVFSILFFMLPKSEGNCRVNIIINNKDSNSEIFINKEYSYQLKDNKKIILDNIVPYGTIAIKTKNNAIIISYSDDNHLFKLTHKLNILIMNNEISINSFPKLSLGKIIDNIQTYDKVIHLFK
ncbi:hypothetical protein AGMMS49587_10310 [Spirochaetia bacterium]|nr:hypothetical protein AGMMS49587_10310 [Spirochaetia bacterium]